MILWKLDDLLRKRGIKGRELAQRMGIGENYLSRVRHEVPDRLSLTLLDGLCRELDCTIADLLEYKPSGRAKKPKAPKPEPKLISDEELLAAVAQAFAEDEAEEAETAPVEPVKATEAVVLKPGSLQAKLERLKRLRGS